MYDFKLLPEALRAALFAAIIVVLTILSAFDLSAVLSAWEPWLISLGSGAIAAAAAAALGIITRARSNR